MGPYNMSLLHLAVITVLYKKTPHQFKNHWYQRIFVGGLLWPTSSYNVTDLLLCHRCDVMMYYVPVMTDA